MKPRTLALASLLAASLFGACSNDGGTAPEPQLAQLAGTYAAEGEFGAFTITTTGPGADQTIEWVALGAFVRLDLRADGTTSGRFFVPGVSDDGDGGDLDEDLTGTWTVTAGIVRLAHDADTVLRDMDFELSGDRLVGAWANSDQSVRIELMRR